jgi:MOSC domain-containing protein YiiM
MTVLSVNLAAAPVRLAGMRGRTGIDKRPVSHAVHVAALGLEGDSIVSTKHHGGPDQAVYIYGRPDYEWWEAALGRPLPDGTFGENLTISDLRSGEINVGDRLHIANELLLEITSPRIPCGTFARRMKDQGFPQKFAAAERPGVYCRVIREGSVRAGDVVRLEPTTAARPVSVVEIFRSFYRPDDAAATLRWHLSAPIAIRARRAKETQLAQIVG